MQTSQVSIVDAVQDCRSVVASLDKERLLAVDSEGVNLGRTGPLTLLQVATPTGHVWLFDILRDRRMFEDGGLKRLLEDNDIVKVMHSARYDADALCWQHKVELRNVHDTQVAHQEIERSQGQKCPARGRLRDVCAIYCPEKSSLVNAVKDIIVTKMKKTEGEYWAKRPLTQEMIDYAANDVIALVPEVYTTQTRLLEEKGVMATFKSRMERELKAVMDHREEVALREEERAAVVSTLREAGRMLEKQRFGDITDKNVLEAVNLARMKDLQEADMPPVVREWKLQQMDVKLAEVEQELSLKGKDYEDYGVYNLFFNFVSQMDDHPLKKKAQLVLRQISQIVLEDIPKKYSFSTPAVHLAGYETRIMGLELRPKGTQDPSINPVLLWLFWKMKLEELEALMRRFQADPGKFKVTERQVRMLRFYAIADVPAGLKNRGSSFLRVLQDQGILARLQRPVGPRAESPQPLLRRAVDSRLRSDRMTSDRTG